MLYLFVDKTHIKLFYLKKTLLGQYEVSFYEKEHSIQFLNDTGKVVNIDLLASAIKEAVTIISPSPIREREVCLILPQEAFQFMRTEVPTDIAATAISAFVKDKARSILQVDLENTYNDFLLQDNQNQKQIIFFAMEKDVVKLYNDTLSLVDLQLSAIVPETLAYFKLFEKTLRREKRENILYGVYTKSEITGYFFDSFGPVDGQKWKVALTHESNIEEILRDKVEAYEKEGRKLNRLILSGESSENVRQDTFTKNVGVWTNPLKRIIPNFYQDYLKMLIVEMNKPLPILQYDVCIGAFILTIENKNFSLLKKKMNSSFTPSRARASGTSGSRFPVKEVIIFALAFGLSFGAFMLYLFLTNKKPAEVPTQSAVSEVNVPATPTMIPTPVASPSAAIARKDIKIKVLNGTGAKGKATEVKELLKSKGYVDVLTDNADNFDYAVTEIQVKKDKAAIVATLLDDLKDNTTSPKTKDLDDKETADVIIIFGKDFK